MLVHISVNKELRHDERAMSRLLDLIVSTADMQDANEARFRKFAVLSGHVHPDKIAELEQLADVVAVEPDEERFLL